MPASEAGRKTVNEFIIVYKEGVELSNITEKMMLIDGALHIRQMVIDVEDYVAQESSRRLLQMLADGNLEESVASDITHATSNDEDQMFYTWNELKGFMRGGSKTTASRINHVVQEVQQELNLRYTFGAIKAAKEVGNPVAHPTDLWDEAKMFAAINVLFPQNKCRTRSINQALRTVYDVLKSTAFSNLIR